MRILYCSNRELASNVALNLLLPALGRHDVQVWLSERGKGGLPPAAAPEAHELNAAEVILTNEVLFPLVERGCFADDGSRFLTFLEMERLGRLQFAPALDPNSHEGLETVRQFAPDLILTVRYGVILKEPVIGIPPLGVLNLHSGLLPAYRGILATLRALLRGDPVIGCTLHYITDRTIDTGPIVAQSELRVERERSLLWHVLALYPDGVRLVADALRAFEQGRRPSGVPATEGGSYYSLPVQEEWEEFRRAGLKVVDARDLVEVWQRFMPGPNAGAPKDCVGSST